MDPVHDPLVSLSTVSPGLLGASCYTTIPDPLLQLLGRIGDSLRTKGTQVFDLYVPHIYHS